MNPLINFADEHAFSDARRLGGNIGHGWLSHLSGHLFDHILFDQWRAD